jgi:hypothetical protein
MHRTPLTPLPRENTQQIMSIDADASPRDEGGTRSASPPAPTLFPRLAPGGDEG